MAVDLNKARKLISALAQDNNIEIPNPNNDYIIGLANYESTISALIFLKHLQPINIEDDAALQKCIRQFFTLRWALILHSNIDYTNMPHSPMNQFCMKLATFIRDVDEDNDEELLARILMPTLENNIYFMEQLQGLTEKDGKLTPWRFIVSADGKGIMPIEEFFKYQAISRKKLNTHYYLVNGTAPTLKPLEETLLGQSVSPYAQLFMDNFDEYAKINFPKGSLGEAILELTQALGRHGVAMRGKEYVAHFEVYEHIHQFSARLNDFEKAHPGIKQKLFALSAPSTQSFQHYYDNLSDLENNVQTNLNVNDTCVEENKFNIESIITHEHSKQSSGEISSSILETAIESPDANEQESHTENTSMLFTYLGLISGGLKDREQEINTYLQEKNAENFENARKILYPHKINSSVNEMLGALSSFFVKKLVIDASAPDNQLKFLYRLLQVCKSIQSFIEISGLEPKLAKDIAKRAFDYKLFWVAFLLADQDFQIPEDIYFTAAKHNCIEIFDALAKRSGTKPDINNTDEHGHTALHMAASGGHTAYAKKLVEAGANVNATSSSNQQTPLCCAAEAGHEDLAIYLVNKDANVGDLEINTALNNNRTVLLKAIFKKYPDKLGSLEITRLLQTAAKRGDIELLEILLQTGIPLSEIDHKDNSLDTAIGQGQDAFAERLLREGAKHNFYDLINAIKYKNSEKPPLLATIRYLLGHSDYIEQTDRNGMTPLHHAAKHSSEQAVNILLETGANANLSDSSNNTALDHAFLISAQSISFDIFTSSAYEQESPARFEESYNNRKVIDSLTEAGGIFSKQNTNEAFSLIKNKPPTNVRRFIENNFDILQTTKTCNNIYFIEHACNNIQETRLSENYKTYIRIHIELGGSLPETVKWSPFFLWACKNLDIETLELILNRGNFDIHAKNERGDTALHLLAMRGNVEGIKLLLKHGADIDAKNNGKQNSLESAIASGNPDAVAYLINHGAADTVTDKLGSIDFQDRANQAAANTIERQHEDHANHFPLLYLARTAGLAVETPARAEKWEEIANVLIDKYPEHINIALHEAAAVNNIFMLNILLDAGANIEYRNEKGETPLILAIKSGNIDATKLFLSRGADPNASFSEHSGQETTILESIINTSNSSETFDHEKIDKIATLLIENGAVITEQECISFFEFSLKKQLDCFAYALYQRHIALHADREKYLRFVASYGKLLPKTLEILSEIGDVNAEDINGTSALTNAINSGHHATITRLVEKGANLQKKVAYISKDGNIMFGPKQRNISAFGLALRMKNEFKTLNYLIEKGAVKNETTQSLNSHLDTTLSRLKNDNYFPRNETDSVSSFIKNLFLAGAELSADRIAKLWKVNGNLYNQLLGIANDGLLNFTNQNDIFKLSGLKHVLTSKEHFLEFRQITKMQSASSTLRLYAACVADRLGPDEQKAKDLKAAVGEANAPKIAWLLQQSRGLSFSEPSSYTFLGENGRTLIDTQAAKYTPTDEDRSHYLMSRFRP
jgi:ankyrin repeat protein